MTRMPKPHRLQYATPERHQGPRPLEVALVVTACAAVAFLATIGFANGLAGWGFLFGGLDIALVALWVAAVMQRRSARAGDRSGEPPSSRLEPDSEFR